MCKFKFEYVDDDYETGEIYGTTTVEFATDTWSDATRHFCYFLRGCGYVVLPEDILALMHKTESDFRHATDGGAATSHCGLDAAGE